MTNILIGPFWPSGLRFERATLIDGADQEPLGPTVPCLAIVESCALTLDSLRLPPAAKAVPDAWVLFETEPPSDFNVSLGVCAFRGGPSSEVAAGEIVMIGESPA